MLVLSDASSVSVYSFNTVIGTSVGIASPSISLVFLVRNEIVKKFMEIMGKEKKHRKIALLAGITFISTERNI